MASLAADTVILLTETWVNPGVHDGELFGSMSYTVHRRDRLSRGDGVLIATLTNLPANHRADLELPDLGAVFVELLFPHGTTLFG